MLSKRIFANRENIVPRRSVCFENFCARNWALYSLGNNVNRWRFIGLHMESIRQQKRFAFCVLLHDNGKDGLWNLAWEASLKDNWIKNHVSVTILDKEHNARRFNFEQVSLRIERLDGNRLSHVKPAQILIRDVNN